MTIRATAAVLEKPRDLQLRDFTVPDIGPDEGLLRVEACGLCGTDYEQWQGHLRDWGGGLPIIPGHEVIGFIEAVGSNAAKRWKVAEGDRVAVEPVIPCGHCSQCVTGAYTRCETDSGYGLYHGTKVAPLLWGGYATHLYLHPRAMLHHLPTGVPPDVMTLFNPLSNAVRWIYEVGKVGLGSTVVVSGPGQRGLLATFVAKQAGATSIIVTGIGKDARRSSWRGILGRTPRSMSTRTIPSRACAHSPTESSPTSSWTSPPGPPRPWRRPSTWSSAADGSCSPVSRVTIR